MDPLRIGIVGAGAIAQRNANEAVRSGKAKIVGIYDTNQKVARDMARVLNTSFCASYEDLLGRNDLEAVLISTPHFLHKEQAVLAARAGKHILIEKPMANTLAEAEAIITACEENKVMFTVNYSFRYLPKIQKARQLVEEGALGDITGVQLISHQFKDPGYWTGARSNSPDDWRASKAKSGGGLLIMTTCHAIDYMYYITGLKATRIYSEYGTLNSSAEVEDIINISFRLENGAVGGHSASSIMRGTMQSEDRIWGTKGTLILNSDDLQFYSTRPFPKKRPGKLHRLAKFPQISWTAEWVGRFATAIRNEQLPDISLQEGWENLAFMTSAYQSMEKEQPLAIPKFSERNVAK